ncbi:MAG: PilZ domain-containing protein [Pseudomonadota bacterium]
MARHTQSSGKIIPIFTATAEAIDVDADERRQAPRQRVLKGAVAAYADRHMSIDCMVRDISATGARLKSAHAQMIPDTFDLIIELDGLEAECEVVWRKDGELGVRFLGAPRQMSPRRKQVISPVVGDKKPSLRRTKRSVT